MFIITAICLYVFVINTDLMPAALSGNATSEESICFKASGKQINDSMLTSIKLSIIEKGIDDDPFFMVMFLIDEFSQFEESDDNRCMTINEIHQAQRSNRKSNCLAVSAIMQKFGWNVRYYFSADEDYLGMPLEENWQIRKGNWIPQDGLLYYLKEFDLITPVGTIMKDDPAAKYQTVPLIQNDLKQIPLIVNLPHFGPEHKSLLLKWQYRNIQYETIVMVPEEQVEWTRILPSSLYGIGYSGMIELRNIGLPAKLHPIIDTMSEYNKVSCLYKFSQSESIFTYCQEEPIKSISIQLIEAKNDCDGRSVFLYALLRSVLDYADSEIVFVNWKNHVALALRPRNEETVNSLMITNAYEVDRGFYLLDPAYGGASYWGAKMPRLGNKYDIIRIGEN